MEKLLSGLRAAAEPTRLRLLAVLAKGELTVTELTRILGQSQPRVSRHLKLMSEAGLLERFQEGAWVFYRLSDAGAGSLLVRRLLELLPVDDPALGRDLERLDQVRREHMQSASTYFQQAAPRWAALRNLYVAEADVERAMLEAAGEAHIGELLDLGTGTGRILEVFAERIGRGLGVDLSPEMLSLARAQLRSRSLEHCQVRRADIYRLELPAGCMDAVTIHQVLHFLDHPAEAVAEAARTLRPGGRLLIVDFAPHRLEFLRTEHQHRRLGLADDEVAAWCELAGLRDVRIRHLEPPERDDEPMLTVTLWSAVQRPGAPAHYRMEAA
ncbi:MAG: ArsR/SmtB family transcription factor [Gammaproteobacteria bacterium]